MATTLHDFVARYSPPRRTTCTVSGSAFRAPCPAAYRLSTRLPCNADRGDGA